MPRLKAAILALALAIAGLFPATAQVQDSPAEKQRVLAGLMSEALVPSRLPEIYADMRRTVREVYLPLMRDELISGIPGRPAPEPEFADRMAKVATFLDYALRASDELVPVLGAQRDAIIGDIAQLQAKYMSGPEIQALRELLDMPAVRKLFNTAYAASRLFTNYSYEEVRSYYALSTWTRELKFNLENNPFTKPDAPAPSPQKVAKAQAVLADLMRVSRLDEMVADLARFAKEVQSTSDLVPDEERESMLNGVQNLEFLYNLQKSIVMAAGPSILAAALSDEQLGKLHLLVLSPVLAKSFGMLHEVVRSATSFTKQDIESLERFKANAEKKGLFAKRGTQVEAQYEAEAKALGEKWRERLLASLKPETRAGLERSIEALEALKDKAAGDDDDGDDGKVGPAPGQRQL